ncbi:peptide MFS transporter [Mangrovibacterium diazotrophicum]|uniref:POT family proton-dependent oligopeptide transporter n=1 Tax=Mangrovibacterium diazotrophicum TaxID=1261403 RepID=A0A419W764_9BACT|nr:peptide MFS transporter [Mangrovibacterium diazotrophicum]RKD91260.1 POT family proton-dependent oligopeptide transporter [Mangrovibacterium diazotrophicum]
MSVDKNKAFFGHPLGLSTLFASEMWERFSYYGMRALLVLFLTATFASGGFGMNEQDAFTIYGIFTGLVYVTPIIGGILADKVLGQRKSIYIGGLTMATGQFLLSASAWIHGSDVDLEFRQTLFYAGLGILIAGNGFFKPNISTMVGELYDNNDPRKDGGFTIFYMGINLGAFLSPLVAGKLGEQVAWQYGFLSAGVGMVIGTIWFFLRSHTLGHIGMPPKVKAERVRLVVKDWFGILTYWGCVVALIFGVILGWSALPSMVTTIIIYVLAIGGVLILATNIFKGTSGKAEWSRIGVILILALFNIFFWAGFEQAGTTFNIFARDNTQRMIGSWEIPATWFQSINAIYIVIFAPIFSVLWTILDKRKLNPNTPMKFAWGMIFLATGFVVMALAFTRSTHGDAVRLVSPLWLCLVYMLHTFGELCLSPIGLSMVTKLSPPKLVSTMMGIWMGSFAAGNFVASQMKAISLKLQEAMGADIQVFWMIAIQSAIIAVILVILSPWLKRMMHGIK